MRQIFIVLIQLFLVNGILAQLVPEFSTKMYFEDAIGNKDSLTFGFDPRIDSRMLNTDFGEVDLKDIPYDEVFEVRGMRKLAWIVLRYPHESKSIYSSTTGRINQQYNCSPEASTLLIWIRYQHLPITIKWNANDFSQNWCTSNSYMVAHAGSQVTPEWHQQPGWADQAACLSKQDSVVITDFNVDGWGIVEEVNIEGGGRDTVWGIEVLFDHQQVRNGSLCLVTSTNTPVFTDLGLFPNPFRDKLTWTAGENLSYTLHSLEGRLLMSGEGDALDAFDLANGMYILSLFNEKGQLLGYQRVIKIK